MVPYSKLSPPYGKYEVPARAYVRSRLSLVMSDLYQPLSLSLIFHDLNAQCSTFLDALAFLVPMIVTHGFTDRNPDQPRLSQINLTRPDQT